MRLESSATSAYRLAEEEQGRRAAQRGLAGEDFGCRSK